MAKAVKAKLASASKPRKKVNGYKFPEKLPVGEILKDVYKKEWILGPSIGKGGFGEIYSASQHGNGKVDANYPFVIKIEPHENGPLFMEKNFYIKVAKPSDVEAWKTKENIKILGIPTFYGSGSHMFKNEKYRFLVIEKFGKDLWNTFLNNNKKFPPSTVYKCAVQVIEALQYIHSRDYIHGDIKGANLLLGLKKGTENNIFLVDFGLACKYSTKEFKRDPKQAHNGTIEYTSCDWHLGIPTRRGDLEILGFNLLHWLMSSLPWENDIKNKEKVHEKKQELMKNVSTYLKKHFPDVPTVIGVYLEYVSKLKYDEEPDYQYCKNLFLNELKKLSVSQNEKLTFSASAKVKDAPSKRIPRKVPVKVKKSLKVESSDECNEVDSVSKIKNSPKTRVPKRKSTGIQYCENSDGDGVDIKNVKKKTVKRVIPKRQPEQNTFDSSEESDNIYATPSQSNSVRNTRLSAKRKVSCPQDVISDHSDSEEIKKRTRKITPRKKALTTSTVSTPPIFPDGNSDEDIFLTPKTPLTPLTSKTAASPNKISWRDAPTVAGNVNNRAGEYIKKLPTVSRTKKK